MIFNKESDFEEALIKILCKYGWESFKAPNRR